MAKEAKAGGAGAEQAQPPKKSRKWLIIIAGMLVVVLGLGAGALFYLKNKHDADDMDDEDVVVEKAKPGKKKAGKDAIPVYVPLDVFTVNLIPEAGEQFLQLIISVEVADASSGDRIKAFTPKIRNNVMLLLSGKRASELLTKEGKEQLAAEIRDQMNGVLAPGAKGDDAPVKEVLFTSFIIQ